MKTCPACNRNYTDEGLTYCQDDGSTLVAQYAPQATMRLSLPATPYVPSNESVPATQLSPKRVSQGTNPLLYILVVVLALLVGGGVVALIKFRNKDASLTTTSTTPTSTQSPDKTQTTEKDEVAGNQNQSTDNRPLTSEGVRNLISRWTSAQNSRSLTAYQACYGASFEGIKRTASGRSTTYDRDGWLKDRWRMISTADGINVEVRNLNVDISEDTATVEFDQYYRSRRYSDWGPKLMKVKMSPGGEKIVYEDLKASYPL